MLRWKPSEQMSMRAKQNWIVCRRSWRKLKLRSLKPPMLSRWLSDKFRCKKTARMLKSSDWKVAYLFFQISYTMLTCCPDELEAFQSLHMLQVTKVLPELFEFRYASSYDVSVPCENFCPVVKEVSITRVQSAKLKYKDAFPALSPLILKTASSLITRSDGDLSIRQVGTFPSIRHACTEISDLDRRTSRRLLVCLFSIASAT